MENDYEIFKEIQKSLKRGILKKSYRGIKKIKIFIQSDKKLKILTILIFYSISS